MPRAATHERTLSRNEAKVILDLEWRGQKTITLAELRQALDSSESYARYVAHRLVKKGWFERLRAGLYQLVPADRGREGVADTNPLIAAAALVSPYFFSFGTACTHYGLTEQVFTDVYIACHERRRPEPIHGRRCVFVHVPKLRFFGYQPVNVLEQPVQMAILERALLDAIDRPLYAGGIGEVSRIVSRAASKLTWETILYLLRKWKTSAIAQRLGYYLDLHRVDMPAYSRVALIDLVRPDNKILLGPRGKWGTTGKLARPWNVVENVPHDVLRPRDELRRRRVVFGAKRRKR